MIMQLSILIFYCKFNFSLHFKWLTTIFVNTVLLFFATVFLTFKFAVDVFMMRITPNYLSFAEVDASKIRYE